jgi:predicted RNA binding protein YcfA (HicA-like mRNA interferase family)
MMSGKLPRLSGKDVIKILCNKFHFKIINSKGSHLTLINETVRPPTLLIVINHNQLRIGTLQGIISKSKVGRQAFLEALNA